MERNGVEILSKYFEDDYTSVAIGLNNIFLDAINAVLSLSTALQWKYKIVDGKEVLKASFRNLMQHPVIDAINFSRVDKKD